MEAALGGGAETPTRDVGAVVNELPSRRERRRLDQPAACAEAQRGLIMALAVFAVVFAGLNLVSGKAVRLFRLRLDAQQRRDARDREHGRDDRRHSRRPRPFGGSDHLAVQLHRVTEWETPPIRDRLDLDGSPASWRAVVAGAVNGFFIAYMRLQPIVVTLATMFVVQGVTLLVHARARRRRQRGSTPPIFTGDVIPNVLPSSLFMLVAALLRWALLRRTRFGVALYAVGSDEERARANGINSARREVHRLCHRRRNCYGIRRRLS